MSVREVEVLAEDRGGGMTVEVAEWQPNREVTLEALRIVDMIHEG